MFDTDSCGLTARIMIMMMMMLLRIGCCAVVQLKVLCAFAASVPPAIHYNIYVVSSVSKPN